MIWARKKSGEPVVRTSSVTDANEFLKKHSIFVVGLFDKFEVCDSKLSLNFLLKFFS